MPDSAEWLGLTILLADVAIVVGFGIRVLLERHRVGATFAWITVLVVVPFAGAILYLMIGERRLGSRRVRAAEAVLPYADLWIQGIQDSHATSADALPVPLRPLERQIRNVVGVPAMAGNELRLYQDAGQVLRGIAADIDRARESVLLEFYIWYPGGEADRIVEAVERAAQRGVRCHILVDDVGSSTFITDSRFERLQRSGAEIVPMLPTGFFRALFRRIDIRNHRKLAVIDNRVAWTGSQNLADPAIFKQGRKVGQWIDATVRLRGTAIEALVGTFAIDWEFETGRGVDLLEADDAPRPCTPVGDATVQVVPSGPGYAPEALHEMLLTTIYSARRELVLTTPYFVPDEAMLTALASAARRGVEVSIVLPRCVDSILVRYASRSHFEGLLEAGVHIYQFGGGLLHSKTITVDEHLSLIGSINLDMRSLWLNFELTLLAYDDDFTARVRQMQHGYIEASEQLDYRSWKARPVYKRIVENAFQLFGPLL